MWTRPKVVDPLPINQVIKQILEFWYDQRKIVDVEKYEQKTIHIYLKNNQITMNIIEWILSLTYTRHIGYPIPDLKTLILVSDSGGT